jgi:hypothetical protein
MRSTQFSMHHDVFTGGLYSIIFYGLDNPGISGGQIESNNFDGSKAAYLYDMTGDENVPAGNNYWNGGTGTPPVPVEFHDGITDIEYDFYNPDIPLDSSPEGAGPDW